MEKYGSNNTKKSPIKSAASGEDDVKNRRKDAFYSLKHALNHNDNVDPFGIESYKRWPLEKMVDEGRRAISHLRYFDKLIVLIPFLESELEVSLAKVNGACWAHVSRDEWMCKKAAAILMSETGLLGKLLVMANNRSLYRESMYFLKRGWTVKASAPLIRNFLSHISEEERFFLEWALRGDYGSFLDSDDGHVLASTLHFIQDAPMPELFFDVLNMGLNGERILGVKKTLVKLLAYEDVLESIFPHFREKAIEKIENDSDPDDNSTIYRNFVKDMLYLLTPVEDESG